MDHDEQIPIAFELVGPTRSGAEEHHCIQTLTQDLLQMTHEMFKVWIGHDALFLQSHLRS